MKTIPKAIISSIVSLVAFAACVFLPAGTLHYWQGWVFLAVIVFATAICTPYIAGRNPAVLERRLHGGPIAETRPVQKIAVSILLASFAALIVVSAFDYRFGWSHVPTWVVVLGDVLVAAGLGISMLVVLQNNYAAASITLESGQTITSTGLYGIVRHPMYSGSLLMMAGIPPALGSYWGLLALPTAAFALVLRILDEEKMLRHDLAGYDEYAETVRSRVVPYLW